MELVDSVESRFGVNIPQEKFEQIATVEDVARLVLSLQSEVEVAVAVQPRLRPSGG